MSFSRSMPTSARALRYPVTNNRWKGNPSCFNCFVRELIERSCIRRYDTTRSFRFRSGTNKGPPPCRLVTNRITNKGFQPKGCSQTEFKNHLIPLPTWDVKSRLLPLSFLLSPPERDAASRRHRILPKGLCELSRISRSERGDDAARISREAPPDGPSTGSSRGIVRPHPCPRRSNSQFESAPRPPCRNPDFIPAGVSHGRPPCHNHERRSRGARDVWSVHHSLRATREPSSVGGTRLLRDAVVRAFESSNAQRIDGRGSDRFAPGRRMVRRLQRRDPWRGPLSRTHQGRLETGYGIARPPCAPVRTPRCLRCARSSFRVRAARRCRGGRLVRPLRLRMEVASGGFRCRPRGRPDRDVPRPLSGDDRGLARTPRGSEGLGQCLGARTHRHLRHRGLPLGARPGARDSDRLPRV